MSKKKKSNLRSTCCKAEIKYSEAVPDFIGDDKNSVRTCYCICSKCGEPCNIYSVERKTWEINPKTRVVPSKKKKNDRMFTQKEISHFWKDEDF